jgi:hypothetical protein
MCIRRKTKERIGDPRLHLRIGEPRLHPRIGRPHLHPSFLAHAHAQIYL